jgi:putative protease
LNNKSNNELKKPELVVGAGDMEKLKVAAHFGADSIYCGASDFSLRARGKNFSREELGYAADYLHKLGIKIYITVNAIIHEDRLEALDDYLLFLHSINADAVIFSDMAVLASARRLKIKPKLHLSTQASAANSRAIEFYRSNGVSRVNLARECSLAEIKKMPRYDDISMEAFIHGAMCMSYSGRCLLSNFLASRGANDGACAQACRWKYFVSEEKRPGEYMRIVENFEGEGSYIFNSRDLMALDLLPQLYSAGVAAFKIEGRIKGPHYVGLVTRAYRAAFDAFYKALSAGAEFKPSPDTYESLESVSNRGYISGFYLNKIKPDDHNYQSSDYIKTYRLVGIVKSRVSPDEYLISVKNNITAGRAYEFVTPEAIFSADISMMKTAEGEIKPKASNPNEVVISVLAAAGAPALSEFDLIRERNSD